MNTIEFRKTKGETLDVGALLTWVERHINWLGNGLYELKIAKKVKRRSLPQNRLMWMWFACIGQDTGQSVDSIHDYYAYKFLPRYITELETGAQVRVPGHTSTLTTEGLRESWRGYPVFSNNGKILQAVMIYNGEQITLSSSLNGSRAVPDAWLIAPEQ